MMSHEGNGGDRSRERWAALAGAHLAVLPFPILSIALMAHETAVKFRAHTVKGPKQQSRLLHEVIFAAPFYA